MAKQTKKTEAAETKKEVTAEIIETAKPQTDVTENKKEKVEAENTEKETVETENTKEVFDFSDENPTETIETTDVKFDAEQLDDSLKKIDMTINTEKIDESVKKEFDEKVNEIKNITNEIKDLENSKTILGEAIKNDPANAKALIENEIKKTETLKKKVQETIKSINPGRTSFTGWWNGMGYDM